jgi:hypothetical protein
MSKLTWKRVAEEDVLAGNGQRRQDGLPADFAVWRAKVPGGWLIAGGQPAAYWTGSVTFLPDPEHAWDVEEVKRPGQ